jgi:hypothetical protein
MPTKREELLAQLAEEEKREQDERNRFEVEIGKDGNYARVPYEKAKSWLQDTFGIDLDAEPKQEGDTKATDEGDGGRTVRFGRKVG